MKDSKELHSSDIIDSPSFEGAIPCEHSADYILPDVFPDVKRLLRVNAKPVLIGRFVSGKRLEFTGAVDYGVLFSSDGENGEEIHCVHFTGDFGTTLGEIDGATDADISVTPRIGSCRAKTANPRKLSIKSTVICDVRVSAPRLCREICEGALNTEEELSLERLTETVLSGLSRTFTADPMRISESIEIDAGMPAADEVISCDVSFHINEARVQDERDLSLTIKGFFLAECIYKPISDICEYRSVKRKLPFTHMVSAEEYSDVFSNCRSGSILARACAVPVEVKTSVSEDGYKERRIIELDVGAELTVRLLGARDSTVTLDAYSVCRDFECDYSELEHTSPAQVISANFSVGESIAREEMKLSEGTSIIDSQVTLDTPKIELSKGRGVLTANARVSCIFSDPDDSFFASEGTIPVKYELPAGELSGPVAFEGELEATDLRTRLDGERMYFDFEVSVCAEICEKTRRRRVERITLSGDTRKAPSEALVTLCYRSGGENLWDIAKRYGTTVRAIEASNKDTSRVILIPSGVPKSFVI